MAWDWLPMRLDIADDHATVMVAQSLDIDDIDLVVGKFHRLWAFGHRNTVDGFLRGGNQETIDRIVCYPGFGEALMATGWAELAEGGVQLKDWEKYNSDTAKSRMLKARRESTRRARSGHAAGTRVADSCPPRGRPVAPPEPRTGHANGTPTAREGPREGHARATNNNNKNNTSNTPSECSLSRPTATAIPPGLGGPPGDLTGFAAFWAAYPKKAQRRPAEAVWAALAPSEALRATILAAVAWQRSSPSWRDPQFVPLPARWLSEERWTDEPPPSAVPDYLSGLADYYGKEGSSDGAKEVGGGGGLGDGGGRGG